MAWTDCMRWRRAASVVRGIGWGVAGLIFCTAATAMFTIDSADGLMTFALSGALSMLVLGIAHGIAWAVDRRGDRLVTR